MEERDKLMRICIHVEQNSNPRLIEEDIELALMHLGWLDLVDDIWEQDETEFVVDSDGVWTDEDVEKLKDRIFEDTGAIVEIEIIDFDWSQCKKF